MFKKIFTPLYMMLFSLIPYIIFSIYSYFNEKSLLIFISFLVLGLLSFLYYFFFNKNKELGKREFWIMTAVSVIIVFIYAILISYFNGIGNMSMPFILIVSVPVVYNMMGIAYFVSTENKDRIALYIAGIFVAPFTVFIIFAFTVDSNFASMQIILAISMYYIIIFLLIHICVSLYNRNKHKENYIDKKNYGMTHYVITFVLGTFLPLAGLILNLSFRVYDFSSPIFFIIAIINGVLLLIPIPKDQNLRLILFYFKSVGYGYILYFFIAFIPLMPLGLIAIILVLGILVFAPSLIAFWQGRLLFKEWIALKSSFNNLLVISVFFIGVLTLPMVFLGAIYNDRSNLENALEYVQGDGIERPINLSALSRSLYFVEDSYLLSNNSFGFLEGNYSIPIISNAYSKIVLHGGTLSQNRFNSLKSIFFDENSQEDELNAVMGNVDLYDYSVETTYDSSINAYRSWINLQLKNNDGSNAEYRTKFTLPEGAFISNYYLYVRDEKNEGILADDRAATFVYNRIVSRSKDPGILHYINNDMIELRVFPFNLGEIRRTGFEVIHKGNLDLVIDGKTMNLKGDDNFTEVNAGNVSLLSSKYIDTLPVLNRTPEYNFVIDSSKNSNVDFLIKEVSDYAEMFNMENANVYFASYKVIKSDLSDFKDVIFKRESGFNLNLAIKNIFEDTSSDNYPIIIAVTENMPNSVSYEYTKSNLYPESEYYYGLNYDFTLTPYSFINNEKEGKTKEPVVVSAVSYNGIPVKKDGKDHLILTENEINGLGKNQYENGLVLYGKNENEDIISNVRDSFRLNILTKNTAFIVMETKSQEEELLSLQEKLFNGEITDIPTQNLSEPSIFIEIIIVAMIWVLKNWYIKKKERFIQ